MHTARLAISVSAALAVFLLTACEEARHLEPMHTEPVGIDLGNAERANLELDIGAGELNVNGGSGKLIDGDFQYNVSSFKPVVISAVNGSHAVITIKEPNHNGIHTGGVRNTWNLRLSDKVLLDFAINCGAGKALLNLGTLELRTLDVHMGAGQVDLDLSGHPVRDYEVNVSGGVGQATVHLPQGVGIRAEAHGGLGSINVSGLTKHGDHYENDLYDKAKVNVRLKVEGGVGEIRIIG